MRVVAWLAACGIVLPVLVGVGLARAQDAAHGAIAVGQDAYGEFVAYGFAWNYITKDEAITAALNACRAGGGTSCTERVWFQNGCGALVLDQYGGGQARSAMTQDQAEARALQLCEASGGSGCTVVGSQCASSGGKANTWSGSERVHAAPASVADDQQVEAQAEAVEAREESLSREQRSQVQRGLAALGFDPGPADGLFGPKTRAAIWDWQSAKGLEATGYLTREETEALGAISQEATAQVEQPHSGIEPADENAVDPDSEGCWVAGKHCIEGESDDDSRYLQLMYKNVCDHRIFAKAFVELNNPNVKHYEYLWGGILPGRTMHRDIQWHYEPTGKHSIEFIGSVNPNNDEHCWAKRMKETAEQSPVNTTSMQENSEEQRRNFFEEEIYIRKCHPGIDFVLGKDDDNWLECRMTCKEVKEQADIDCSSRDYSGYVLESDRAQAKKTDRFRCRHLVSAFNEHCN